MKPPAPSTPQSRDIFGAEFNGTPSHHRVLKPPGGGSSDIFGTSSGQETNVRRVKNHMASSVFLSDDPSSSVANNTPNHHNHHHHTTNNTGAAASASSTGVAPAKQSGNDSFCRLFGPPSPPKSAIKPKNKFQSNILPIQDDHVPESNGNTEHVNGDNIDAGGHAEPMVNGNSTPVMNGNRSNGNSNANSRARVPPGGFSSGLW